MKLRIFAILLAVLSVVGLSLTPASAAAATSGPFIQNSDPNNYHTALCQVWDQYGSVSPPRTFEAVLAPGQFSPRDCHYFTVWNGSRTLYKSLATGALYWTPCGEDLPSHSAYDGWQFTSSFNSVQIIRTANSNEAPATSCTWSG